MAPSRSRCRRDQSVPDGSSDRARPFVHDLPRRSPGYRVTDYACRPERLGRTVTDDREHRRGWFAECRRNQIRPLTNLDGIARTWWQWRSNPTRSDASCRPAPLMIRYVSATAVTINPPAIIGRWMGVSLQARCAFPPAGAPHLMPRGAAAMPDGFPGADAVWRRPDGGVP
jgi:hypothetical protein